MNKLNKNIDSRDAVARMLRIRFRSELRQLGDNDVYLNFISIFKYYLQNDDFVSL